MNSITSFILGFSSAFVLMEIAKLILKMYRVDSETKILEELYNEISNKNKNISNTENGEELDENKE